MTAQSLPWLNRLDADLWVDRSEIAAVRTYTDQLLQRRVELTLRNGHIFEVAIGPDPGTGNPRTDEQRDADLAAWLTTHLADILDEIRPTERTTP
jgi:hypothetical protein